MQPLRCFLMLTLWTVSIATGMGDVMLLATTGAGREAIAVGASAAAMASMALWCEAGEWDSARYTLGHRW